MNHPQHRTPKERSKFLILSLKTYSEKAIAFIENLLSFVIFFIKNRELRSTEE